MTKVVLVAQKGCMNKEFTIIVNSCEEDHVAIKLLLGTLKRECLLLRCPTQSVSCGSVKLVSRVRASRRR